MADPNYTISMLKKLNLDFTIDESASNRDYVVLRTKFKDNKDVFKFVEEVETSTNTKFRVRTTDPKLKRLAFHRKWVCQHSSFRKRKNSKKNAECLSFIDVVIKDLKRSSLKSDKFLNTSKPLPCIIKINLKHTHSTENGELLRRLPVAPKVIKEYEGYFENGLTVSEAQRFHKNKLIAEFGYDILANSSYSPTDRQAYHIYNKWRHEGKPANLYDVKNPDWIPTLKMGYKIIKTSDSERCVQIHSDERRGKWRKMMMTKEEAANSQSETATLMEKILKEQEYFKESKILSMENPYKLDTSAVDWNFPKPRYRVPKAKRNMLNKKNTGMTKQQSYGNENFTFKKLIKNLSLIKKPNDFWGISPHSSVVICARWNENFTCEKRILIENSLTVKVFLKKWEINVKSRNITCIDDISNLLTDVESYKIMKLHEVK